MMNEETLSAFSAIHLHLDSHPTDWSSRLVVADIYEDIGDPSRAAFQRWLAKHGKAPVLNRPWLPQNNRWYWWVTSERSSKIGKLAYKLPKDKPDRFGHRWNYESRQKAEDALFGVTTDWILNPPTIHY